MARQLPLNLDRSPVFRREGFIVSPSNAEAVRAVDAWPDWPGGCLVLSGPEGVGKTHLARAWADAVGAAVPSRTAPADVATLLGKPVLLENADGWLTGEALFHLINMAAEPGAGLLMTSRARPMAWASAMPDLRSRLNALTVAEIQPPDEDLLAKVMEKIARDRHMKPAPDVFAYLIRRVDRSVPAFQRVIEAMADAALAENRGFTRALAKEVLDQSGDLWDGDD